MLKVALGRVGILLGLEVSRLARSNADWYRLLDMCAITDTLLALKDLRTVIRTARETVTVQAELPGAKQIPRADASILPCG
jgi:hypothetical protein